MRFIQNLFSLFFRLVLIYFIIFIWVRYYSKDMSFAIWLTALLTFFVEVVIRIITNKKTYKIKLKQVELKQVEIITNTFIFNDDKFAINFFYNLAKQKHNATKKKDYILIEDNNTEKVVLYPYYTYRNFSTDDLIIILNKIKSLNISKLIICTSKADKDAVKFSCLLSFKILILEKEETYIKLLKEYNYFPDEKDLIEIKETTKNSFKTILVHSISPGRTKGYFISSLILLFSVLIVPYNIYYLVFSSLLLLLSLISFLSPIFFRKKMPVQVI